MYIYSRWDSVCRSINNYPKDVIDGLNQSQRSVKPELNTLSSTSMCVYIYHKVHSERFCPFCDFADLRTCLLETSALTTFVKFLTCVVAEKDLYQL